MMILRDVRAYGHSLARDQAHSASYHSEKQETAGAERCKH